MKSGSFEVLGRVKDLKDAAPLAVGEFILFILFPLLLLLFEFEF